ncbi:Ribosomal RNA small subunit methyltransferase D [bioreactor metagenome]|uniref:Ribosomal RNA small subunit methyltransferase D n=1 Tax=bioreactor metagenome TaxID=1076179 RepID=A0A645E7E7_9ZZZZ
MMLDVFAGSGSVAFEALSRGMAQAVCIDRAYQAIRTIRENAVSLQVMEQIELIKGNYPTALKQISGKYQFDLVFIDPPYRLDIIEEMTDLLNAYQLLKEHAWLIFEVAKETASAERYNGIIKVKEASYGISKLLYYQKEDL